MVAAFERFMTLAFARNPSQPPTELASKLFHFVSICE